MSAICSIVVLMLICRPACSATIEKAGAGEHSIHSAQHHSVIADEEASNQSMSDEEVFSRLDETAAALDSPHPGSEERKRYSTPLRDDITRSAASGNLKHYEAVLDTIANLLEIVGVSWGGPNMILGFMQLAAGTGVGRHRILTGTVAVAGGLASPAAIAWLAASAEPGMQFLD